MMLTLSRRIQRQAPRQIAQISFCNAVGFGFNTGQVVYLLALAYGANDTQMGCSMPPRLSPRSRPCLCRSC